MENQLRLILDPPRPALLNMAIDETLAESQKNPKSAPVLRLYFWEKPAYSIGYFQDAAQISNRFGCAKKKIPVVKRMTGGGAVFHDKDLTFSLCLRLPSPWIPRDTKSSYLKINEALRESFRKSHPKVEFADCKTIPSGRAKGERICFESPACYDLLLDGKKIVGASQRRQGDVMLYQSTVFFEEARGNLTDLILDGFKRKWGIEFLEEPLTEKELEHARKKENERRLLPGWFCDNSN
jgi:lipoate-protein ligase A